MTPADPVRDSVPKDKVDGPEKRHLHLSLVCCVHCMHFHIEGTYVCCYMCGDPRVIQASQALPILYLEAGSLAGSGAAHSANLASQLDPAIEGYLEGCHGY